MSDAAPPPTCVFCAITQGHYPAALVFEDNLTVAFLDITAVQEGHTLVIPKRHVTDLWETTVEDAVAVMRTARRMALRIREVLQPDGLTLFQANGEAGWQDVFHVHLHVVPRTFGDHLHRPWKADPVALSTLEPTRARLSLLPADRRGPP